MLKAVVFALIVPMVICFAQADRAAVTGTVSDPTHLAMASAHVSLVYPSTGLRRETQSVVRRPEAPVLFGTVSISQAYRDASRGLMVSYPSGRAS